MCRMHYLWIIIVPLIFLTNLRQLGSLGTFRYLTLHTCTYVCTYGYEYYYYSIFAQLANGFALSVVLWFDMEHFHLIKLVQSYQNTICNLTYVHLCIEHILKQFHMMVYLFLLPFQFVALK